MTMVEETLPRVSSEETEGMDTMLQNILSKLEKLEARLEVVEKDSEGGNGRRETFKAIVRKRQIARLEGLREGNNFSTYVDSFMSLINQVEVSEEEQVSLFVEGLKGDKKSIRVLKPNTLQRAIAFARALTPEEDTYTTRKGSNDQTIKEVKEVKDLPIKQHELLEGVGIAHPQSVLLPGLTDVVIRPVDGTSTRMSDYEWIRKYTGEESTRVGKPLVITKEHAPSITFMDKADSMKSVREVQRIMLEVVNGWDDFKSTDSIQVMMAMNYVDILDQTILSLGWIDKKIEFLNPSERLRWDILKTCSGRMNLGRSNVETMQGNGFEALYGYSPPRHILRSEGTTMVQGAFGVYKTDLLEDNLLNVALIDIGRSSRQVCIDAFKKREVRTLTHSYDRKLGGRDCEEGFFLHFATRFKEQYKIDSVPTKPIEGQKTGTSDLRKKVKVFMEENYLANWILALFNSLPPEDYVAGMLVLGGDGRYFNREAAQIIIKIASRNSVGKISVGQEGILSTPTVYTVIRKRKANGEFIMSANYNPGGPEYDWGIKFNYNSGQLSPESITDKFYVNTLFISEIKMADIPNTDLSPLGFSKFGNFAVEVTNTVSDYLQLLENVFDFQMISNLLSQPYFRFISDIMHAITGAYAKPIFVDKLGASSDSISNGVPLEDFGHGHGHPDPNLKYANDVVDIVYGTNAPDFGAASNGDGDRTMILGWKLFGNLMDPSSRKILVMGFEILKILGEPNLTRDQFIDLCILPGGDYCDSIKEVGGSSALRIICQHRSFESILGNRNKERHKLPFGVTVTAIFPPPHLSETAGTSPRDNQTNSLTGNGMAAIFNNFMRTQQESLKALFKCRKFPVGDWDDSPKPFPFMSAIANSVVTRGSKVLDVPTMELCQCFEKEALENIKQPPDCARILVEFCSFKSWSILAKGPGDRDRWSLFISISTRMAAEVDNQKIVSTEAFARITLSYVPIADVGTDRDPKEATCEVLVDLHEKYPDCTLGDKGVSEGRVLLQEITTGKKQNKTKEKGEEESDENAETDATEIQCGKPTGN